MSVSRLKNTRLLCYVPAGAGDDKLLVWDAMPGFFIGSETIELSYNTATSKFYWNYLHFPIYSDDGNISTKRLILEGADVPETAINSIMLYFLVLL